MLIGAFKSGPLCGYLLHAGCQKSLPTAPLATSLLHTLTSPLVTAARAEVKERSKHMMITLVNCLHGQKKEKKRESRDVAFIAMLTRSTRVLLDPEQASKSGIFQRPWLFLTYPLTRAAQL